MTRKKKKKQNMPIFPPVLGIILAAIIGLCGCIFGGGFFREYLNEQIYKERVSQLTESTELLYTNLENTLDSQWIYVSGVISGLNYKHPRNLLQTRSYLKSAMKQMDLELLGCKIILLDDRGIFYDSNGKQGIWSGSSEIDDIQERQSFLTDSMGSSENQMAFAEKLKHDLMITKGSETISITHVVLLKDMSVLTPYFRSKAYYNNNLTYILRDNGVKMYSDEQQNTSFLKGRNVFRTLEQMEYTHYDGFESCKADLDKNGFVCADVFYEGKEYYYCLKKMPNYDWTMLFLVSADYVAANTMDMVNSIVRTFMFLAGIVLIVLCTGFFIWYRNRKTRSLYQFELESNERLSEVNQQLEVARKAAEEAFHIAEEANQSKSQFLSNMSHDMRTPMNAIVGFTTLLSKECNNPEKVQEYTKKIAFSSQHLLGLINDVLDMSKIEAGKMKLSPEEEELDEIIENIDILVRPQTMAKKQQFDIITNVEHKMVIADKLRLNQILLNLLSNAVKYTPQGGHIQLRIQELPQQNHAYANYRFIVEDNGYGMSEEYIKHVFQVFSREENTRINKIQGSGLGMAITKNLVNLMGGSISVKSKKGIGSVFTLDLELCISEKLGWAQQNETHAANEMETQILKDMHVLVVEDNEINAEIIVELLKMEGAICRVCENGQEAVDIFEKSGECDLQLILMDVQMPIMNGYEATRAIRNSAHPMAKTIPIIAMTANAFVEDIHDALEAGMNAHVAKPVDMKILKKAVMQVMNG